jgi:hypothetical protein
LLLVHIPKVYAIPVRVMGTGPNQICRRIAIPTICAEPLRRAEERRKWRAVSSGTRTPGLRIANRQSRVTIHERTKQSRGLSVPVFSDGEQGAVGFMADSAPGRKPQPKFSASGGGNEARACSTDIPCVLRYRLAVACN